jgi:hypothetical protein
MLPSRASTSSREDLGRDHPVDLRDQGMDLQATVGRVEVNETWHFWKIGALHNATHKKPAVNTAGSLPMFLL